MSLPVTYDNTMWTWASTTAVVAVVVAAVALAAALWRAPSRRRPAVELHPAGQCPADVALGETRARLDDALARAAAETYRADEAELSANVLMGVLRREIEDNGRLRHRLALHESDDTPIDALVDETAESRDADGTLLRVDDPTPHATATVTEWGADWVDRTELRSDPDDPGLRFVDLFDNRDPDEDAARWSPEIAREHDLDNPAECWCGPEQLPGGLHAHIDDRIEPDRAYVVQSTPPGADAPTDTED